MSKGSERDEGWRLLSRIEPGPFFVTLDANASDTEGRRYTVSRDPQATGWETDCGYSGYGLLRTDAELIVWLLNNAEKLIRKMPK